MGLHIYHAVFGFSRCGLLQVAWCLTASAAYGSRTPEGAGSVLSVAAGQQVRDVNVRLARCRFSQINRVTRRSSFRQRKRKSQAPINFDPGRGSPAGAINHLWLSTLDCFLPNHRKPVSHLRISNSAAALSAPESGAHFEYSREDSRDQQSKARRVTVQHAVNAGELYCGRSPGQARQHRDLSLDRPAGWLSGDHSMGPGVQLQRSQSRGQTLPGNASW